MPTRLKLGVALALGLAGPVKAEPAGCVRLVAAVEGAAELTLLAPPAGTRDGWCVLDGARSTGAGAVRVSVATLRLKGEDDGGRLLSFEMEATGLRVAPAPNNRDVPDWLRDLMRLRTADVQLALRHDQAGDLLLIESVRLALSGGGEFDLAGEVAGAGMSAASLLTGRVISLRLVWKNDGRTLRPLMQALGERLEPEAKAVSAVDTAREGLRWLVEALPEGSLAEGAAEALDSFILALPNGRGRLVLDFGSDSGIGAAQLGLLAMADDPASQKTLERFFSGTRISASWTPGIQP